MKILLLGRNGQVGWELQRALAPLGPLTALGREPQSSLTGDLSDIDGLVKTVRTVQPDIIVNAAAYTAVDKAETEQALARRINAEAPGALAAEAKKTGAVLIHYSTDYVFDGSGSTPWRETDATAPLNAYGAGKLDGENAIVSSGCRHLILRTSWVYAARGANFARTMLRLARERDTLNVVSDQHGTPTGAELIADATAHALRKNGEGLYHMVAGGETTWYDYARFAIGLAQRRGIALKAGPDAVKAIPTSAYPLPATRPLNSRLDTTTFQRDFGLVLPAWQAGVERAVTEILEATS